MQEQNMFFKRPGTELGVCKLWNLTTAAQEFQSWRGALLRQCD